MTEQSNKYIPSIFDDFKAAFQSMGETWSNFRARRLASSNMRADKIEHLQIISDRINTLLDDDNDLRKCVMFSNEFRPYFDNAGEHEGQWSSEPVLRVTLGKSPRDRTEDSLEIRHDPERGYNVIMMNHGSEGWNDTLARRHYHHQTHDVDAVLGNIKEVFYGRAANLLHERPGRIVGAVFMGAVLAVPLALFGAAPGYDITRRPKGAEPSSPQ